MAKKNSVVLKSFRIAGETHDIISKVSEELIIPKNAVIRLLLNRAARQLKHDSMKVGGYSNLSFIMEKINGDVVKG